MTEKTTLLPSELEISGKRMGAPTLGDSGGRQDKRTELRSLRISKKIVRRTECIEEVIDAKWSE